MALATCSAGLAVAGLISVTGGSAAAAGAAPVAPASIVVRDGMATVQGVIRSNSRRCEVDGACRLLLQGKSGPIELVYHHGEHPPCANQAVTAEGLKAEPGDTVRAFGVPTRRPQGDSVDLCCPACSLIVELGPRQR